MKKIILAFTLALAACGDGKPEELKPSVSVTSARTCGVQSLFLEPEFSLLPKQEPETFVGPLLSYKCKTASILGSAAGE